MKHWTPGPHHRKLGFVIYEHDNHLTMQMERYSHLFWANANATALFAKLAIIRSCLLCCAVYVCVCIDKSIESAGRFYPTIYSEWSDCCRQLPSNDGRALFQKSIHQICREADNNNKKLPRHKSLIAWKFVLFVALAFNARMKRSLSLWSFDVNSIPIIHLHSIL